MPDFAPVIQPLHTAELQESLRRVFVRDLMIQSSIGIHDHELNRPQRVRINLDLAVREDEHDLNEDFAKVVCYEGITKKVRSVATDGHIKLVETLAQRIADICLQDHRVRTVRVRVEKLDALEDVGSVGVEIERRNGE